MLWLSLGDLCRICLFRKVTVRRKCLHASDAGAPKSLVDRVFGLLPREIESVLLEIVDLILACESLVAYRCDDLHLRCENLEYDIEAYLVVAGSCTSVSYCACAELLHVLEDLECLEYSFRTYRKRVGGILEYVSVDEVFDTLIIIGVNCIYGCMGRCSECEGTLLDSLFLLCRESSGVHHYSVDLKSFFILKVRDAERCVQTAAESEYNFIVHIFSFYLLSIKGLHLEDVQGSSLRCAPVGRKEDRCRDTSCNRWIPGSRSFCSPGNPSRIQGHL